MSDAEEPTMRVLSTAEIFLRRIDELTEQLAQAEEWEKRERAERAEHDILLADMETMTLVAATQGDRCVLAEAEVQRLQKKMTQAEERLADLEVALSLSDSNTKEAQERAETAEGERDEARDEVKRLREALDYRIRRVPEIALPTEADLDWMMNAFQRHTSPGGDHSDADTIPTQPDRIPESLRQWWDQNVLMPGHGQINAREIIGIILTTWESGRAKAGTLAASEGQEGSRR